jgi:hypothetical protein
LPAYDEAVTGLPSKGKMVRRLDRAREFPVSLYLAPHQMLENSGVLECPDLPEAPYRPVVDKQVRQALAARESLNPPARSGVLGGVDDLKAVASSPE